jgi:hypothetical protein
VESVKGLVELGPTVSLANNGSIMQSEQSLSAASADSAVPHFEHRFASVAIGNSE